MYVKYIHTEMSATLRRIHLDDTDWFSILQDFCSPLHVIKKGSIFLRAKLSSPYFNPKYRIRNALRQPLGTAVPSKKRQCCVDISFTRLRDGPDALLTARILCDHSELWSEVWSS